jgi:hypothetical protein
MPRRSGQAAEIAASKRRHTQWRYLLRNPDFQNRINELLDTYDFLYEHMRQRHLLYEHWRQKHGRWFAATSNAKATKSFRQQLFDLLPPELQTKVRSVAEKLTELEAKRRSIEEKLIELCKGLSFDPLPALRRGRWGSLDLSVQLPELSVRTVAQYEKLLDDADPVSVIEDHDGETVVGPVELGDSHTLYLKIDLACPRDVLMEFVDKKLSEVKEKRGAIIKRNPGERQRADKANFNIAVYDLVVADESFPAIAARLHRPVSSVESAYRAACRNIFGSAPPRRKRHMPLVGYDFKNHIANCEECKNAKRPEDFCAPTRVHANQDYRSRRELLIGLEDAPAFLEELSEESVSGD